jgi:hypothetical protein
METNQPNSITFFNESFDITKFSYSVHLFSLVNSIIDNVVLCCWSIITNDGYFDKVSKLDTLKILKHKQFFIKALVTLFNDTWGNIDNSNIISQCKIEKIMSFGKYKHEFCCLLEIFEINRKVMNILLGQLKLQDIINKEALIKSVSQYVDSILASEYENIQNNYNDKKCICEEKLINVKTKDELFIYTSILQ